MTDEVGLTINRNYRAPVLAAVVLLVGLSIWVWWAWQQSQERHREELRRFCEGVLLALDASHASVLQPLGPEHRPGPGPRGSRPDLQRPDSRGTPIRRPLNDLKPILRMLEESSPKVRYVGLFQENRVIAEVGEVQSAPEMTTDPGEMITGGLFFVWRKLGAPGRALEPDRTLERDQRLPQPPQGGPVGMIGVDAAVSAETVRQNMVGIASQAGLAALGAGAFLIAWVQGIRRRLLVNQLELEQAKSAHVEELSLAASGLAHETKNPLGIIRGLAQQLEQAPELTDEERRRAGHIQEEADRAVGYLGDFISYAKMQSPQMASVELARLVNRAVTVLEADAEQAGLRVEVDIPDCAVWADSKMLLQILLNLLLNSFEASPDDSVVEIRLRGTGRNRSLEVVDHGRGIAPEMLETVCKPYVTGRPDGHGLGLAIVKRMIEQQGWSMHLSSQPGDGTSVRIDGLVVVAQDGVALKGVKEWPQS